jgi:hypothetical protein
MVAIIIARSASRLRCSVIPKVIFAKIRLKSAGPNDELVAAVKKCPANESDGISNPIISPTALPIMADTSKSPRKNPNPFFIIILCHSEAKTKNPTQFVVLNAVKDLILLNARSFATTAQDDTVDDSG